MADLLLELFSEEIPARMQRAAAKSLGQRLTAALEGCDLAPESVETAVTPRRLVAIARGVPASQPDRSDERKGPKVGSPEKALAGFLKSVGKASVDECEVRTLPKGEFYFVTVEHRGRSAMEVLPDLLTTLIAETSWPKSMRWGSGEARWVRPLHRIVALLDGEIVPCRFGEVEAGRTTEGHRFRGGAPFDVSGIDEYRAKLEERAVVLDSAERERRLVEGARELAAKDGLTLQEDAGLAVEVAGLVEDPVPLLGRFPEDFLRVPPEILSTAMRSHQKYFSVSKSDGSLAPAFVVVSNQRASDGGAKIIAGNERVLRARLADVAFFWDQDLRTQLADRATELEQIVYQHTFGEGADRMSQKAERLAALSRAIGEKTCADADLAERAGALAKCDLTSGVVGEFPELQGVMGRYYAEHDGEDSAVRSAIADHYQPKGPDAAVPSEPVSIAVALADKLDTLVGFFAVGDRPTGSKDPFALRRSALGILRIILENELRLPLRALFAASLATYPDTFRKNAKEDLESALLSFFADRLEVHLRDSGVRFDLIRAAFAAEADDDLLRLVRRVEALQSFLETPEGKDLLAGTRRASNIVRIEEKKDGTSYTGSVDVSKLVEPEERALDAALTEAEKTLRARLDEEDFGAAMSALASLRDPVDTFFEKVTVNQDDAALRVERLKLLARIREALQSIADLSVIQEG